MATPSISFSLLMARQHENYTSLVEELRRLSKKNIMKSCPCVVVAWALSIICYIDHGSMILLYDSVSDNSMLSFIPQFVERFCT